MSETRCPSCRAVMTRLSLPAKLHGTVELDLCFPCQGIWFDGFESHQIAPGGVIELFKLIHAHREDHRLPLAGALHCPRCEEKLLASGDVVKSGRFTYHRCPQNEGRFTVFGQFMIEKGFVCQLTPLEITSLAARVQVVHCSGCGAPVDIRHDAACTHCRAPIAILDPAAVEQALASFQQAEVKRTTVDVDAVADALLANERSKQRYRRDTRRDVGSVGPDLGDLVSAGVDLALTFLSRR